MTDRISLLVHLDYDADAGVWFVSKSDIPGLSLEAASPSQLVDRVLAAAPALLELNAGLLVNSVEAHMSEPSLDLPELRSKPATRPRMTVLPVFDTPLELACA